jgi:DNA-binding NarL/FixJ family response regulator
MSKPIRLTIIVRHQLLGECLAHSLATQQDIDIEGIVLNVRDTIFTLRSNKSDIALMDATIPDDLILEIIKMINLELPDVKQIVFGLDDADDRILNCIEAGAKGYISMDASLADLISSIRAACQGEVICSPRLAYQVFSRIAQLAPRKSNRIILELLNLTPREIEILRLIADGLSNKQIAEKLNLSFYTVKNHVHNILEKLRLTNRSELVHFALLKGLVKSNGHLIG